MKHFFDAQTRAKKPSAHLVCASKKGANEETGLLFTTPCGRAAGDMRPCLGLAVSMLTMVHYILSTCCYSISSSLVLHRMILFFDCSGSAESMKTFKLRREAAVDHSLWSISRGPDPLPGPRGKANRQIIMIVFGCILNSFNQVSPF